MEDQVKKNEPRARLRVLVLDEELPYPPDAGKKIRTWNLLKELAARHEITYLCYASRNSGAQEALLNVGIKVVVVAPRRLETGIWLYGRLLLNCFSVNPFSVSKHNRLRFHQAFSKTLVTGQYDLIHCEWTPYAQFTIDGKSKAKQSEQRLPVLIATHNIEADILRRRADRQSTFFAQKYFRTQALRMERFERSMFARAEFVTVVSEQDGRLAREWGAKDTGLVANGVAIEFHRPSLPGRNKEVLFLGSLDWFPNVDAIRYFLDEIFPRARRRDPDVTFNVVGRRPDMGLRKLIESVEGATLTGEVPDVRPYLERAAVVVVPLRIGGGTRIKILEAMATGKIVVSTSIGAEGLDVEHGVHLLIADRPEDFSEAIVRALDVHQLAMMPGQARARAGERYSWSIQARELESCWYKTAASI